MFAARNARRGSVVTLHVRARRDDGPPRAAVVAGRKVGGAVVRNRAKRRLRAALAQVCVAHGTDLVAVAAAGAATAPFGVVRGELDTLLRRAARPRQGGAA